MSPLRASRPTLRCRSRPQVSSPSQVRVGFPPRLVAFPVDPAEPLASVGLAPGDPITVSHLPGAAVEAAMAAAAPAAAAPAPPPAARAAAAPPPATAHAAEEAPSESSSAARDSCAYCFEPLPPFQRFHCLACCSGMGPGAQWFSCLGCAQQRSASSRQQPPAKRQRRDADSSEPCFEPGHAFAPVYGNDWLTLPAGPPAGKRAQETCPALHCRWPACRPCMWHPRPTDACSLPSGWQPPCPLLPRLTRAPCPLLQAVPRGWPASSPTTRPGAQTCLQTWPGLPLTAGGGAALQPAAAAAAGAPRQGWRWGCSGLFL